MKAILAIRSFPGVIREHGLPFIRENGKLIAQFILTIFFIAIGIWFIKHEKAELHEVGNVLVSARWLLLLIAFLFTCLYIFLQGLMYVASFASVKSRISLWDAIILFLKRNFISVFLPAGGVSSLAFFSGDIEKKGITKSQIHFASSIYGFVGILSVVIVAIPVLIYSLMEGTVGSGEWYALVTIILLKVALFYAYLSILRKGMLYKFLVKIAPPVEVFLEDLRNNKIDRKKFILTVLFSVLIEFVGIAHLYIAMIALHVNFSILAAAMGYIVSVMFLIVSPFLRGLGAIEVSMSYILVRYGYANVEAIAITFFYRFFEFWLPLFMGVVSFMLKINKLLMRVLPAIVLFVLGIINIISVLTPALAYRLEKLKDIVPVDAIAVSNYFVMLAGLFLLVTAAFMLKGLRAAWWFALVLCLVSIIGHLTKAIDYEEAIAAFVVLVILLSTQKEYYIKSNPRLRYVGIQTSLLSMAAVLIYGTIGFYFLDKKQFNINFDLLQSIRYTLQNYVLIGSEDLVPNHVFARNFLYSINISGFFSISFLIYTLIRPYVIKNNSSPEKLERAKMLLEQFGRSSMDYFKTYFDKIIYAPEHLNAFLAYRISGNFAVVLEDPVAEDEEQRMACVKSFDAFCLNNGLKSIFYRVSEEQLPQYKKSGKKYLFLGQEGVVDLRTFTLEGGSRKSMRNAVNKVRDRGYKATVHLPPVKDGLLQKLKSVSDEWLNDTGRKEIIFSQGMFTWQELKQQVILTVENPEEKIVGFLNIIPSFAKGEATYDLIRKTNDAPNGIMDFMLIELFNYLKAQQYNYINLGFAPMSGINVPQSFPEKSMKFAYEKIRSFSHYKGLRDFKEKFLPEWHNKYLIYEHDYDLLQVPSVLTKVIKP